MDFMGIVIVVVIIKMIFLEAYLLQEMVHVCVLLQKDVCVL